MNAFCYRQGVLHCEDVPVVALAERFGTPTYVYSRNALIDHYTQLARAFAPLRPTICYSIKSCHNLHVLRILREQGAAFDAVSGAEVRRALEAGADPGCIVFAGVGKTEAEIRAAIEIGIGCFNIESEAELEVLCHGAQDARREIRGALRINPDVDAHTHVYTTTGKKETKFGVDLDQARQIFARFRQDRWVRLSGLHLHLGSPVNTVEPYVQAITRAWSLIRELCSSGAALDSLNIGGGFGVYDEGSGSPTPDEYAQAIVPLLKGQGLRVFLEPGRSISASAGILVTRTIRTKTSGQRRFVVVDAAMTDLLRPALYGAFHFVWPACPGPQSAPPRRGEDLKLPGTCRADVVGPVCESTDFLAKDRWLPPVAAGDLLAVFCAGAYGAVLSSQYNSRPRAAEVLVDRAAARLIRRREIYDDLVATERDV